MSTGFLRLRGPVQNGRRGDPDDVANLKRRLQRRGYYTPLAGVPLDGTMDRALDDGLKRFQKDRGLKVDGLARPGGETEAALNAERDASATARRPHPSPAPSPAPSRPSAGRQRSLDRPSRGDVTYWTGLEPRWPEPKPTPLPAPGGEELRPVPFAAAPPRAAASSRSRRPEAAPSSTPSSAPSSVPSSAPSSAPSSGPSPSPAVDPDDPEAVEAVLTRLGYRYRPDGFGRIGRGDWLAPDGRTLAAQEIAALAGPAPRPAATSQEVGVRLRYTPREWANLKLYGTPNPTDAERARVTRARAGGLAAEASEAAGVAAAGGAAADGEAGSNPLPPGAQPLSAPPPQTSPQTSPETSPQNSPQDPMAPHAPQDVPPPAAARPAAPPDGGAPEPHTKPRLAPDGHPGVGGRYADPDGHPGAGPEKPNRETEGAPTIDDALPTFDPEQYHWESHGEVEAGRDVWIDADGPIRADLRTAAFGIDSRDYYVQWYPKDANGDVAPIVTNPGTVAGSRHGGHVTAVAPNREYIEPPFPSEHGYRVRVWVPRDGGKTHGTAASYLQIFSGRQRSK